MNFVVFFVVFIFVIKLNALVVTNPPYGQLKVTGTHLTKLDGTPVQLRGMSLFWSQWTHGSIFYNNQTIYQLKCFWNANIVRAAMGADEGGYLQYPEIEYAKITAVIEAAISNGIYVIVDWHSYDMTNSTAAIQFFTNISMTYGHYPHVLYETWNEPKRNITWATIKAYHIQAINAIRANDPDNVIIAGTPDYSGRVDIAAKDPINGTNILYTYHFYAASILQEGIDTVSTAINMSLPVFVTEYGTVDWDGNGPVNESASQTWWKFLDQNKISYVNWSIGNKNESSAALLPNSTSDQVGIRSHWTQSGSFVNQMLWGHDQGLVCSTG